MTTDRQPPHPRARRSGDVAASLAVGEARFDELFRRFEEVQADAREARDGVVRITAILEQQDIGHHMAELRRECRDDVSALREDVVSANTRIRNDQKDIRDDVEGAVSALAKRIEGLETARTKVVGIAEFFQWLSKVAPWLAAGAATAWVGMEKLK